MAKNNKSHNTIIIYPLLTDAVPLMIPWVASSSSAPPDFDCYFSKRAIFPANCRYIVVDAMRGPSSEYILPLDEVWPHLPATFVMMKRLNARGYILFGWCTISRLPRCPIVKIAPNQHIQFAIDIASSSSSSSPHQKITFGWHGIQASLRPFLSVDGVGTIQDPVVAIHHPPPPPIDDTTTTTTTSHPKRRALATTEISSLSSSSPFLFDDLTGEKEESFTALVQRISQDIIMPLDVYFYNSTVTGKALAVMAMFVLPEKMMTLSRPQDNASVIWQWAYDIVVCRGATEAFCRVEPSWTLHQIALADQPLVVAANNKMIAPDPNRRGKFVLVGGDDGTTIQRRWAIIQCHQFLIRSVIPRWPRLLCEWLESAAAVATAESKHIQSAIRLLDVQTILRDHYSPLFLSTSSTQEKELEFIQKRMPLSCVRGTGDDDMWADSLLQLYRYFHGGTSPPRPPTSATINTYYKRSGPPDMTFMDDIDIDTMPPCLAARYRLFLNTKHLKHPFMVQLTTALYHIRRRRGLSVADTIASIRQWYISHGVTLSTTTTTTTVRGAGTARQGHSFVPDLENFLKDMQKYSMSVGGGDDNPFYAYFMTGCARLIKDSQGITTTQVDLLPCPLVVDKHLNAPVEDIEDLCKNHQNQLVSSRYKCSVSAYNKKTKNSPGKVWFYTSRTARIKQQQQQQQNGNNNVNGGNKHATTTTTIGTKDNNSGL